jgi:hypothetical protein
LWNVTRSTKPASTSCVDRAGSDFIASVIGYDSAAPTPVHVDFARPDISTISPGVAYRGASNSIGERETRLLPATPTLAGKPDTELAALRSSMPNRQMRRPWISMVLPSMIEAMP